MYDTKQGLVSSSRRLQSNIYGYSPAANVSDISCSLVVRKNSAVNLVTLNLLGQVGDTRMAETRCFYHSQIQVLCRAPSYTREDVRGCIAIVASRTSVDVAELAIGAIPVSDQSVVANTTSGDDGRDCVATVGQTVEGDISCVVLINSFSTVNHYLLDVGYSLSGLLNCITVGEAYTEIRCSVSTHTKATDILCTMYGGVEVDFVSEVGCVAYIQSGPPAAATPMLIIAGDRYFHDTKCVFSQPAPTVSSRGVTLPGAIDRDISQYSVTRLQSKIMVSVYNLVTKEIVAATLRVDDNTELEAETISFDKSLWTVKFDTGDISIGSGYLIRLTISPDDKVVILSSSRGQINL